MIDTLVKIGAAIGGRKLRLEGNLLDIHSVAVAAGGDRRPMLLLSLTLPDTTPLDDKQLERYAAILNHCTLLCMKGKSGALVLDSSSSQNGVFTVKVTTSQTGSKAHLGNGPTLTEAILEAVSAATP